MSLQKTILQIDIHPVPASRPRVARNGFVYYTKGYTDFKTTMKTLMTTMKKNRNWETSEKPIEIQIAFGMAKPKGHKKTDSHLHIKRPDIDNLIKGVLDSMNEIFFKDDSQIISLFSTKHYADEPYIKIQIEEVSL